MTTKGSLLKIERLASLSPKRRAAILARSSARTGEVEPVVRRVVEAVRQGGDKALLTYTRKFDRARLASSHIRVSAAEIKAARRTVAKRWPELVPAIKTSISCLRAYHEAEMARLMQSTKRWEISVPVGRRGGSIKVGQAPSALDRVGVYVPGGNAVLLTSAFMAITPARVAGVREIVLASPPSRNGDIDPRIIVAADLAGADLIVRAGGAQAIAALAYGTESVPRVAKIAGPGNIYVATAKALVAAAGACAIDLPAGPSEVVIVADKSARADYVARDMLAQSEHDADACAVLVTTSPGLASDVAQLISLAIRHDGGLAAKSIPAYGAILVVDSLEQAVDFANDFAPEHLEIMTANPKKTLAGIRNAGGIFLGPWSPVAIGDYVCPNHILPTGGAARYTSGVNVSTFLKRPSTLEVPQSAIPALDRLVEVLSKAEGLYAQHGASVHARNR